MDVFLIRTTTSLLASSEGAAQAGEHAGPHMLSWVALFVYVGLVLAILFGFLAYAKKGLQTRVFKNPITQATEQVYLFIEQMCVGTIGPHGRKYIPYIMTLWLVIFVGNMVALFMPAAPTADLSFNLGLALVSIMYVQYEGMRSNGVLGHFRHFAGPKLGIALILISGIIFVIEIISELMKNVSLSLRLFGNIEGGHQAVEAMNHLGEGIMIGPLPFPIPFGFFLLPIKLLTVVVQAMIFTLLTCVYLSLVTHHEEEHDGHSHGAEVSAAH
ncbi:MAG: F0F1 ATP synthase subunit A [Fimbriimonadaceae bacterium]|nr:F0F1 ATP synthase subunit A [Fimbriimonadaceae bacterium]